MLPNLNDDEQALFEELVFTGIGADEPDPVPSLIRAFAWIEQRRLRKEWKLFELGLLMVRGQLRRTNKRHPLVKQILRYLERRRCRYLDGIDRPTRIPKLNWEKGMTPAERVRWRARAKRNRARLERDARQQAALLRRSFERGEPVKTFPVIAFKNRGGGLLVTVWGIQSKSGQWPTPRDVQRARCEVWKANQPETKAKGKRAAKVRR